MVEPLGLDLHGDNFYNCRTMPKKFPPITALDWSPLHNLKHLKKKEREKQEAVAAATPDSGEAEKDTSPSPNAAAPINNNNSKLVAKEHFVFTDPEGQLYHFSVEGNSIKDGTKIDAEGGLGELSSSVDIHFNVESSHIENESNIPILAFSARICEIFQR